jgi:hypothetical protein
MAKKISILYAAIPIIYISVIGVFLYLQFTSVEPFSEKIGSLSIDGTKTAGTFGKEPEIKKLTVRYKGLIFPFSADRSLVVQTEGSPQRKLTLKEYNGYAEGVELIFEEGTKITFELGGSLGEWMTLRVILKNRSVCFLPFDSSRVQVQRVEGIPVFSFETEGDRYHLTMPSGSSIDYKNGYFHLPPLERHSYAEIIVRKAEATLEDPYLFWFSQAGAFKGQQEYEERVKEYLDRAYLGWDKERYVMGQGMWRMRGEEPRFSESLAQAWIAEALRRGAYGKATVFVSAAMDICLLKDPESQFHYLASPFVGRLMRFKEEYFERLPRCTKEIERLIRARDPALFKVEHLIVTILNSNMLSQIDELVSRLVVNLDIESQGIDVCLGLMETYLEVRKWYQEGESYFNRFREVIHKKILPRVRVREGASWLLVEGEDFADLYLTIKAGYLLREIGSIEDSDALQSLGRGLILSTLSLGDELGFLPRRVRLTSKAIQEVSDGYIPPEDVYAFISSWPYYPEEKPLYPLYDPGSWVWTAAQLDRVVTEAGKLRFSFSFPTGIPHYIMIQGIQPVSSVELQGMKIVGSLNYQTFINGWYYDENSLTLYIKLFQDSPQEEVVVDFR